MPKKIDLKDLRTVDTVPGADEVTKKNSKQRKQQLESVPMYRFKTFIEECKGSTPLDQKDGKGATL